VLSDLTLHVGVRNVFDTLPPYDYYSMTYTSPLGDIYGRRYWISLKKQF
jgi:outer membrane receptor protein involved in Fe transport